MVFDIAFANDEYAANAQKLKNPGFKGEEATALAQAQREIVDQIRKMVIQEAGLPTAELNTDIQNAQEAVMERLSGMDLEDASSDDLLRKLGVLKEGNQGGATFTYPADLFPEGVNEKWNLYLLSVRNHIEKGKELRGGYGSQDEVEHADRMRRFAHNRISHDIDAILGFDKLPDEEWDFEQTRKLVAKMREAKFIGEVTSESLITSRAMARGMGKLGLSVIATLSGKKSV